MAAQILYSPYLVNPDSKNGAAYPFSILISINDNTTMSIFKDGYIESPWLLYDSHGRSRATIILFETIEALGQYQIFQNGYQAYEVYLRREHYTAIEKNFKSLYKDTFNELEPFQSLEVDNKVAF